MSRLEEAAIPFLKPMIWGKQVSLAPSAKLALARWMVKTTMAWDFFHARSNSRLFLPSERYAFYREPHLIPELIFISCAFYRGGQDAWMYDAPPFPVSFKDTRGRTITGTGHSMTMSIGQVALQLFIHRWPNVERQDIQFAMRSEWDLASAELWPLDMATFDWPPKTHALLDNETFERFANRWRDDLATVPPAQGRSPS